MKLNKFASVLDTGNRIRYVCVDTCIAFLGELEFGEKWSSFNLHIFQNTGLDKKGIILIKEPNI